MDDRFFPGDPALTLIDKTNIPRGSQVIVECFIPLGDIAHFKQGLFMAQCDLWLCHVDGSVELVPYAPSELMPLQPPDEPVEVPEFQGVVA